MDNYMFFNALMEQIWKQKRDPTLSVEQVSFSVRGSTPKPTPCIAVVDAEGDIGLVHQKKHF